MVSLHDSLVSSSARRLPVRKRVDLVARRQQYLGKTYWVVKEPVGLNYFRFQEEEYAILQMFDGQTSLDEIKERFEEQFPPQKITLEELQQFLGQLHRSGLVIVGLPGQGRQLFKRRGERKRKEVLGALSNLLCLRFKGMDPERTLNWLYHYTRWIFSPIFLGLCLLLVLSAGGLVLVEFDIFRSKLPAFHDFFNLRNAAWLAVTLGVTKIFHEFGHGLSCKHFGGECHEIGIMFLVLTPCLYCNVSDSWMLPSKWRRAAIGAAGMCVELVLASICTFLWWFSEPCLLHYLCLNVMFICSVSTLMFNGNPLLRYDGYYILADLLEIPNMRQKATSILSRKLGEWCLGLEPQEDPFLPERNQTLFALYSVAAACYRWLVLAGILWFLNRFFKPYGLQVIGQAIIIASLVGLVVMPLYKVGKFFYIPGRLDKVKKPRMYASLAVLVALILGVLFVPLPYSVICSLEIQARDAKPVYVDVPDGGQIAERFVRPGDRVVKDQQLARLVNLDLDMKIEELAGEQQRYQMRLVGLRQRSDASARDDIRQVEESLSTISRQLEQKKSDQARLVLLAPIDGTVLPPPLTPAREDPEGQLPSWSGTPLEPENDRAYLEDGVLYCQVGDPRKFDAILVVDQTDVEFIREMLLPDSNPSWWTKWIAWAPEFIREMLLPDHKPKADVNLDELPNVVLHSEVLEVADTNLKITPKRLSSKAGGPLATTTDPVTGAERLQNTSYQARVPLDDPEGELRLGLRGTARVYTAWQPLGTRLWRLLTHTFNFKM
jgi:putative peptide zinc metalloprotease protein